ncbi:MAG: hypothetical protein PF638_12720 [Candidatus Delongbacteria bacterium]|jgi:hypothetical protein|nr:hypothetical protein [Candidatus Delongbacteria bacterium]
MKRIIFVSILMILGFINAQFRADVQQFDPRMNLMTPSTGSLFDMSRIKIDHSFSMNYSSTGTSSAFVNEYVAGINYRISDPMNLRFELGMSYTPYSTFTIPGEEEEAQVYLKSATFDYRPNKQFHLQVGFNNYQANDLLFNSLNKPFGSNFLTPVND